MAHPHRLIYLNTWSSVDGTIREELEGMLEEMSEFLRVNFKISKVHTIPSWHSLPVAYRNSQLLLQHHACLSAAMIPTMTVIDSN